jgi:hypothetical protein
MSESRSTPTAIPAAFSDELVRNLALLHESPPETAASTIALMRFGSRALLEGNDPPLIEVSDERPVEIKVTTYGWKVIEACARELEKAAGADWADEGSDRETHEEKFERALDAIRSDPKERSFLQRVRALLPV